MLSGTRHLNCLAFLLTIRTPLFAPAEDIITSHPIIEASEKGLNIGGPRLIRSSDCLEQREY